MLKALADTVLQHVQRRPPVMIRAEDTVGSAVAAMHADRRGGSIVQDGEGRVTAIFSQQDLLTRVDLSDPHWGEQLVGEVMTRCPSCVRDNESLAAALQMMVENGCRSLPVIDAESRPIGVISIRDILRHVAEHFPQELINLPSDPSLAIGGLYGG